MNPHPSTLSARTIRPLSLPPATEELTQLAADEATLEAKIESKRVHGSQRTKVMAQLLWRGAPLSPFAPPNWRSDSVLIPTERGWGVVDFSGGY